MMREQQARIAEQQAWIAELEKAKNWLEEQRANWQGIAEERERLIGEQRAWIGELETSKNRLEGEWFSTTAFWLWSSRSACPTLCDDCHSFLQYRGNLS
jgi:hypothetical protein